MRFGGGFGEDVVSAGVGAGVVFGGPGVRVNDAGGLLGDVGLWVFLLGCGGGGEVEDCAGVKGFGWAGV